MVDRQRGVPCEGESSSSGGSIHIIPAVSSTLDLYMLVYHFARHLSLYTCLKQYVSPFIEQGPSRLGFLVSGFEGTSKTNRRAYPGAFMCFLPCWKYGPTASQLSASRGRTAARCDSAQALRRSELGETQQQSPIGRLFGEPPENSWVRGKELVSWAWLLFFKGKLMPNTGRVAF